MENNIKKNDNFSRAKFTEQVIAPAIKKSFKEEGVYEKYFDKEPVNEDDRRVRNLYAELFDKYHRNEPWYFEGKVYQLELDDGHYGALITEQGGAQSLITQQHQSILDLKRKNDLLKSIMTAGAVFFVFMDFWITSVWTVLILLFLVFATIKYREIVFPGHESDIEGNDLPIAVSDYKGSRYYPWWKRKLFKYRKDLWVILWIILALCLSYQINYELHGHIWGIGAQI